MSKYNVGDVVKLRDDLTEDIEYGEMDYNKEMDRMKNKPIKLLRKSNGYENCYEVEDEIGENWFLSDEMIEGLWEECKEKQEKLKLIDVLNMIAKGELKEGTKVKFRGREYEYKSIDDGDSKDLFDSDDNTILDSYFITVVSDEVELIEPSCEHEWEIERIRNGIGDVRVFRRCVKCGFREEAKDNHFADVGKMEKIEELEECEFYTEGAIVAKLNEVIRKLNSEQKLLSRMFPNKL